MKENDCRKTEDREQNDFLIKELKKIILITEYTQNSCTHSIRYIRYSKTCTSAVFI